MKNKRDPKSILAGAALMTAVSAITVCLSACGNANDNSKAEDQTTAVSTVSQADTAIKTDKEKLMLTYSQQPGGDMTLEEFEAKSVHYEFYYTGVIKDKNGNEFQLSDEDFNKVKEYAEKVITGDKNVKEDNGDDMPSFSVSAFDEDGNAYDLKTLNSGWIEGTDELDTIAEKYFPEDK